MAKDDDDYATGGFNSAVHAEKGGNVHIWWRNISGLPSQRNRDEVRRVIEADEMTYKILGYRVDLIWSANRDDADLHVHHKHTPTPDEIAVLKGAAASTWVRAGWGGSS